MFTAQSPILNQRTDSLKRRIVANASPVPCEIPAQNVPAYQYSSLLLNQTSISLPNSPKIIPTMRHVGQHAPSPKGSPLRRANTSNQNSPKRQITEEQWIDGPRLSKAKVAEARHMMREVHHVKQCETWIDGPKTSPAKSLVVGSMPASSSAAQAYGYMDNHKKSMIRKWVENQSSQVLTSPNKNNTLKAGGEPPSRPLHLAQFKAIQSDDEEICIETTLNEIVNPITESLGSERNVIKTAEISIRMGPRSCQDIEAERNEFQSHRSASSVVSSHKQNDSQEDEDQDSGPSEVPPALPLLEPLGSREISHDSLHMMCSRHVSRESLGLNIQTIDCGLQVTEEEIARTMGW